MRVTTFCDSSRTRARSPLIFCARMQRRRELLCGIPPTGFIVPDIGIGTPQHDAVAIPVSGLQLESPIIPVDIAQCPCRSYVILRPKIEIDGFFGVERMRLRLGGLCSLLPVCTVIVKIIDRGEKGIHVACEFPGHRFISWEYILKRVCTVVPNHLPRRCFVGPVRQLRKELQALSRGFWRAPERDMLDVDYKRSGISGMFPDNRFKRFTARKDARRLLIGPDFVLVEDVRRDQPVLGSIRLALVEQVVINRETLLVFRAFEDGGAGPDEG